MFVDPQLHLYTSFLAVICYYLIPSNYAVMRQWLLIALSFFLILFAAPFAGFVGILLSIFSYFSGTFLTKTKITNSLFYLLVLVPILVMVSFELVNSNSPLLERLGVSYFAIKSISVLFDCKWGLLKPNFRQVLMLNLWFPIYSAGPIERAATFSEDKFQHQFNWEDVVAGLSRIVIGFFKTIYIATELIRSYLTTNYGTIVDIVQSGSVADAYLFIFTNFLFLYINFSGYTDIAIGTSRMFGFRILENFNSPFLATSVQNFWQRWHISLSTAVSRYLFIPIVRATGKPPLAIFLAFTIIGLWHELSILYLIWGILHGSALSVNLMYNKFAQKKPSLVSFHSFAVSKLFFGIVTVTYVSWVSIIANSPSVQIAFELTILLLGIK